MNMTSFSTLQYSKELQAVGFSQSQAEVIAEGVGMNLNATHDFATKKELYEVRDQLNEKIDQKFDLLDVKFNLLDKKVSHLEGQINCMADVLTSKLFNRLGGLMVACMSVGISAAAFFTRGIA
jgi:hypothetical protein